MNVKIIYSSWVPKLFKRKAIVLYPYIFISKTEKEAKKLRILHHEWMHILQIRKEGLFKFYLKYVGEWFVNLFKDYKNAYLNISYEKEACFKEKKINLPKPLK